MITSKSTIISYKFDLSDVFSENASSIEAMVKDNVIKFTLTKKSEKVSSKEDYETYVNNISEKNIIFSPNEETTFHKPS
jgi:uncharacterized Fe-S cluster-containing MiaB family protein